MTKAICGWHDKRICKICHHCEDCGVDACIHTERGRFTKRIFNERLERTGKLSNGDIYRLKTEIDSLAN